MFHLQQKCFLKLLDFSPEEIHGLLDLAADLKARKKAGIAHACCSGKNIALTVSGKGMMHLVPVVQRILHRKYRRCFTVASEERLKRLLLFLKLFLIGDS